MTPPGPWLNAQIQGGLKTQDGERELTDLLPCVISPTTNKMGLKLPQKKQRGENESLKTILPCVFSPT